MQEVKTIIIGAGIAGLSCAKQLHDRGEDFLVLTKDIGGRISTSKDGSINYAAYIVNSNYKHLSPYIKRTRKIRIFKDCRFHIKERHNKLFSTHLLKKLPKALGVVVRQRAFNKEYARFKKDCETMSQAQAIRTSPLLKKLASRKINNEFPDSFSSSRFAAMMECLGNSISFSESKDKTVFGLHQSLQLLLDRPHEFIFLKEKLIKGFENRILIDPVMTVKKTKKGYEATTSSGKKFSCSHLVVATPFGVSNKLLGLSHKTTKISVNMLHIEGKIRREYSPERYQLFEPGDPDACVIARQSDGTYLYYFHGKPKTEKFFSSCRILDEKSFDPAFESPTKRFIESKIDENYYMIGDFNIVGLEDAFITGIYAANQIE